jgi:multidrug transporter EmrE-like cation transporter
MLLNFLLVFAAGSVAVGGDFLFKRWSVAGGAPTFAAGALLIAVSAALFGLSLRSGSLITNGALLVLVNAIGVLAVSQLVFHERLSALNWAGLALALVAAGLLES